MEKIICWRGTDGDIYPIKCTCEKLGYPNLCTDETGDVQKMYDNTHFRTKEEAWKSIVKSVKAGLSLSARSVIEKKKALYEAEKNASDSLIEFYQVKDNSDNPFQGEM